MNLLCKIVFGVGIILNCTSGYTQIYKKEGLKDCHLKFVKSNMDTAFYVGSPDCSYDFTTMDTSFEGSMTVIIQSEDDIKETLYSVTIANNLKQAIKYSCQSRCYYENIVSYEKGVINGTKLQYSNGRLEYFYIYKEGKIIENYFNFVYSESGTLKLIRIYNSKGKIVKTHAF